MHVIRRKRVRPSNVILTILLVIVAIAVNQLWLWVVVATWLLLAVGALLSYVSGKVL